MSEPINFDTERYKKAFKELEEALVQAALKSAEVQAYFKSLTEQIEKQIENKGLQVQHLKHADGYFRPKPTKKKVE